MRNGELGMRSEECGMVIHIVSGYFAGMVIL